ncbi:osmoprotectant transport system ATP-binding protein [Spinactinospora alkalitolerans]|uniref:ABC-type quaternary amine transporter n=1 Tax=Spinactinospora alkalitolerans TaxID=687207 RepID=A0A852TQK7_9ACTN|nr:ABC transporter ATP-binding protein [Spinactinospora alkalitolerans]NYE46259.1 osmoprotectant transport system ATP-binding protein [Spinactinospora alkalitolerans]
MPETTSAPQSLAQLAADGENGGGVPIELIEVSKRYGSTSDAAVDDLTMTIPAGQIVVLLGPSGCGKTTTMRMINRLIEPTSGRITIGEMDARAQKPDELRRHIGYVIQQAGLFPHMTVASNIAQVPQMLGWDGQRITRRVDELLELVGLAPSEFRGRYPRQLSGGQQQRVGVARALAADPPVLLMDEPFGALDPITRESLQDELLRLQEELSKTIVFVTHDVDEALKLGDRIAILDTGSKIVQYATPEEILANPASDYVEQFVGGESSMKLLKLTRVRDVALENAVRTAADEDVAEVRRRMEEAECDWAVVLDDQERPLRWESRADLEDASGPIGDLPSGEEDRIDTVISGRSTLQEAVEALINADQEVVPVVGRRRRYVGAVTLSTVQQAISEVKERERRLRRERLAAGESAVSVTAAPAASGATAEGGDRS